MLIPNNVGFSQPNLLDENYLTIINLIGLQLKLYVYVNEVSFPMTAPTEIRQRAITLLEQLPGESLVKAVAFLESLSHEYLQLLATPKTLNSETALLQCRIKLN
jgi:hypothetical protein